MRKLKLQVQISIDGFICGPNGEMDWMTWDWDDELKKFTKNLTEPVDCILLGKNIAAGFIEHWAAQAANPEGSELDIWGANKFNDTYKIVFSHSLKSADWENTDIAEGDSAEHIKKLKQQSGGDIIAYGGANFVTSLIKNNLIDEYYLFINPAAIGKGMTIFGGLDSYFSMELVQSKAYECGIVVNQYKPKTN